VKRLVQAGAAVNHDGWPPLAYACLEGHVDVARYLIEHGADVNGRAVNGATPLMLAARSGQIEIAKLLIDKGADIDARNDSGLTAMVWAAQSGNTNIVELLQATPIE
jgi:hypothetical protein